MNQHERDVIVNAHALTETAAYIEEREQAEAESYRRLATLNEEEHILTPTRLLCFALMAIPAWLLIAGFITAIWFAFTPHP